MVRTDQKPSGAKKAVKVLLILAAVIAGVLLILTAAVTLWLPSAIMTGNRQTLDEAFAWQTDHYDTSFYEGLKKPVLDANDLKFKSILNGLTDNEVEVASYRKGVNWHRRCRTS